VSPSPDSWSVAQVVEHLAVVERRVTALFRRTIADGRIAAVGQETETSSQLEALNPNQFADRTQKLVGPAAVSPTGTVDVDTAWAALQSARNDFRAAVADADGLALGQLTAPHPFFGALSLYQWIGFIGGHDARHARQILEIGASLAQRPAQTP
jgi:hypothetical protein